MKETRFIAQNKEKWQESETLLKESVKDPEKLSSLFTQVIDDLSYSRTYYPNRSVRVYLNKVAREYFSIIYSHQKGRKNMFRQFWLDELPHIVYVSRKQLIISLVIFLFSMCIGTFSSIKDPQFASIILGESYVEMTKANIEKGDPMAVYKEANEVNMFLGITFNNLMVAFRTYVFGVFLSVGTVAILLYNGIMVGCFQFFFIERGLLAESALTIWLHGTLEISSIILAGGAGLTLGSGFLFPGTYSRLQAFQITAMRSLKLMLGIAPIFVLAAIIESFLTRYTEVPDLLRLFLIVLSAFVIIGYFVIYPWMKSKKGFDRPLTEVKLPAGTEDAISTGRIKNNVEIINDSFTSYKKFAGKLLPWLTLVTLGMTTAEFATPEARMELNLMLEPWQTLFNDLYYALKTTSPVYIAINAGGSTLILYKVFMLLLDSENFSPTRVYWKGLIRTAVLVFSFYTLLFFSGGWGFLVLIFTFCLLLLLSFALFGERSSLSSGVAETSKLASEGFRQIMTLQWILVLMTFSFLLVLSAPLLYMNTTILQWNFAESDVWSKGIVRFIEIFVKLFAFNLIIPVFGSSAAYLFFSLREVSGAENLKKSILMVGARNLKGVKG
jgi:uncharacterized membrane protein SpoIIM required for sporulation